MMEQISRAPTAIQTPFRAQECVPGPHGQALRSVWLFWQVPEEVTPCTALTVSAWVALETYRVANARLPHNTPFLMQDTTSG